MSSWDTAGSKAWAEKLKEKLPSVQFEGKGLWATEGVVTIPYNDQYPLAYQSHFYEFEYLEGENKVKSFLHGNLNKVTWSAR